MKYVQEKICGCLLPSIPGLNLFSKLTKSNKPDKKLPPRVDLTEWCSPIKNQLNLRACSALAVISLIEYFEKKVHNKHFVGSSLFVYKTTRKLIQINGDSGAFPRDVISSLAMFGIVHEKYWPYTIDGINVNPNWDKEPCAFLLGLASNYKVNKLFCHDLSGEIMTTSETLLSIKKFLIAGIPSVFSYWAFPSNVFSDIPGGIAYPSHKEFATHAHTLSVFGYDDDIIINNIYYKIQTTGAFLIKNSRGTNWGYKGYGWLPYEYILNKLAYDFWSLLSLEWIGDEI